MIADNLNSVRRRIARCCEKVGRPADSVLLVCVTKEASVEEAEEVLGLGVRDLGENRVQELVAKYRVIADKANWHLIGHLQTNKVKDAVKISTLIHSLDSTRLVQEIDKEAKKINKIQDVLVEVNTSGEAVKYGLKPDEAIDFFKEASLCPNINIKGLMTMTPETDDPERARPYFRKLRELRDKIKKEWILSMGMSNDFEVAIEEGSNIVRIGRAIFG